MELDKPKAYYLDDKILAGYTWDKQTSLMFAMYSQYFTPGMTPTQNAIADIYDGEVASTVTSGEFMGLWHVAALDSVLGKPIVSVYPEYGCHTVRKDIQRIFLPQIPQSDKAAYIMWSHTQHAQEKHCAEKEWQPNHFVVLLPLDTPQDIAVEDAPSLLEVEGSADEQWVEAEIEMMPFLSDSTAGF